MNKLLKLGIVPFVTLLACGGGGGGKGKTGDASTLVDGSSLSGKDALKSEVGPDALGQAPDTVIVPATDTRVPGDVLVADGSQAVDVAAPDAAVANSDGAVAVTDLGRSDAKIPDASGTVDALVKQDTVLVIPPDADVDSAVPDAALDGASPDTTVVIDTALPVDTLVANPDGSTVVPTLTSVSPSTGTVGQVLSLTLLGTGFEPTSEVRFDGQAVTPTSGTATSLSALVSASLTDQAGAHAVLVSNGAGRTSNVLYVNLVPPAGAPEILDYNPDNGVTGDTITLIGNNLASGTITITGPGGLTATPGTTGTGSWLGSSVETLTFVLPSGWQTGPIVVANTLGSSRGKIFNVGKNLTTLTGVTVEASSEYSSSWVKARGADNDLGTSWFSANYDCASDSRCTSVPWFSVAFPAAQTVSRIAVRGNREYVNGYDFMRARIDVLGASGTLWSQSYDLPNPDRDVDITLASPLTGVTSVKFTSLQDESLEPGFSELEVF